MPRPQVRRIRTAWEANHWPNVTVFDGHLVGLGVAIDDVDEAEVFDLTGHCRPGPCGAVRPLIESQVSGECDRAWLRALSDVVPGGWPAIADGRLMLLHVNALNRQRRSSLANASAAAERAGAKIQPVPEPSDGLEQEPHQATYNHTF